MNSFSNITRLFVIIISMLSGSIYAAQYVNPFDYKNLPDDAKYIVLDKLLATAQSIEDVDLLVWNFAMGTKETAFLSSPEVQQLIARRKREFIQENLDKTLQWPEAVRIDIVRGGLNARGARGNTVLTYLASGDERLHPEYVTLAQTLIYYGADVNAFNSLGRTPLMQATLNHNTRMMNLLLQNSATNINSQDAHGKTPIMLAATLNPTDSPTPFELLLSREPDVGLRDNQGKGLIRQLNESTAWFANYYKELLETFLKRNQN